MNKKAILHTKKTAVENQSLVLLPKALVDPCSSSLPFLDSLEYSSDFSISDFLQVKITGTCNVHVCTHVLFTYKKKVLHQLTWAPRGPEVQHLGFRGGRDKELQHRQGWFRKSAWGWCGGRPAGASPGEPGCPPHGHTWRLDPRRFA